MSWEETLKVNSDLTEPLNFNNYINDISSFGVDSYVFDKANERIWRKLITNSLTMFGHRSIHGYVYERLNDEDIDYLLANNAKIGEALNSFYDTTVFNSGNIDSVLKNISNETFNKVEYKIQRGINRYISSKMSTKDCGKWLGTLFNVQDLTTKTSVSEILSDTDLWNNVIMNKSSLRYIITFSIGAVNWMSKNYNSTIFKSFIETISVNINATFSLIEGLYSSGGLSLLFEDDNFLNMIANSKIAMEAICYSNEGFKALLNSSKALTKVFSSSISVDVIKDSFIYIANSENHLSKVKDSLTDIEGSISNLTDGNLVLSNVTETKNTVSSCISSLNKVTNKSDILFNNIDQLLKNKNAMVIAMTDKTSRETLLRNSEFVGKLVKEPIAIWAMVTNRDARIFWDHVVLYYGEEKFNTLLNTCKNATSLFKEVSFRMYGGNTTEYYHAYNGKYDIESYPSSLNFSNPLGDLDKIGMCQVVKENGPSFTFNDHDENSLIFIKTVTLYSFSTKGNISSPYGFMMYPNLSSDINTINFVLAGGVKYYNLNCNTSTSNQSSYAFKAII